MHGSRSNMRLSKGLMSFTWHYFFSHCFKSQHLRNIPSKEAHSLAFLGGHSKSVKSLPILPTSSNESLPSRTAFKAFCLSPVCPDSSFSVHSSCFWVRCSSALWTPARRKPHRTQTAHSSPIGAYTAGPNRGSYAWTWCRSTPIFQKRAFATPTIRSSRLGQKPSPECKGPEDEQAR
jgi:hypothetical protein